MGNFCSSCGAETAGGKFCPKCGSPQSAAAPPQYSPQAPLANAPAKRGSPVLKIVLISVAVLLLLGIIGAVRAFIYVKDKVHEQVAQIKESSGGLHDALASAANSQPTQAGCELLSKEKVATILDAAVVRSEGNEAGDAKEYCKYWSEKELPAEASGGDSDDAERKYSAKRGPADLKDLDDLIKGITASTSAKGPLLAVNVFRGNGKIAVLGVKTAAVFSGHKAQNLEGPWDEAYFGPFDAVMAVRKGDNAIVLNLGRVALRHEKGLELAKALVAAL